MVLRKAKPMTTLIDLMPLWLPRILGALALVGVAGGISYWQNVGLEVHMAVAVGRAFVQLLAIGFALELIFNRQNPLWIGVILLIMMTVAGRTAGKRADNIPSATAIAMVSVAASTVLTLGSLLLLQVFAFEARFVLPIAGMIIGNAMIATGLCMARLRDEIHACRQEIETALALGASSRQAVERQLRAALSTGMTPSIDSTKTVGLIALPGAMTGMILAGVTPLEAVQLQVVVMYMLIGATAFASLIATYLTFRQLFTPFHQLKLPQ
jgi:putative ABC transport system permease protein